MTRWDIKITYKVKDNADLRSFSISKFEPLTEEVMEKFKTKYILNLHESKLKFEYVLFEYIDSSTNKIKIEKVIS